MKNNVRKWFEPIENPVAESPFTQGVSLTSEKEFQSLCESVDFQFFLDSSVSYKRRKKKDVIDPYEKFTYFIFSITSLITCHEFKFFNILTIHYEKEIQQYLTQIPNLANNELLFKFDKIKENLAKECYQINNLNILTLLLKSSVFPIDKWINNLVYLNWQSNLSYNDNPTILKKFIEDEFQNLDVVIQRRLILGILQADALSKNDTYEYLFLLGTCLQSFDSENIDFKHITNTLNIPHFWELLTKKNNLKTLNYFFKSYYHKPEDLLQVSTVDNLLFISKFAPILTNTDEYASKLLPNIGKFFRNNLFEKNPNNPQFSNFQLLFNDNFNELLFIKLAIAEEITEKSTVPYYDFFQNNPFKENTVESLLWKDKILQQSLFAPQIQHVFSYCFEKIEITKDNTTLFMNIENFLNDAMEVPCQELLSINQDSLQYLLDFLFVKFAQFTSDDFKFLAFSILSFASKYNIDLEIPEYQSRYADKLEIFISIEEFFLELKSPQANSSSKNIKF